MSQQSPETIEEASTEELLKQLVDEDTRFTRLLRERGADYSDVDDDDDDEEEAGADALAEASR